MAKMDVRVVTPEDGSFRAVFDACLDAIVALDERGCITDANAAVSHLGTSRERVPIGQHVRIFFPPDEATLHTAAIAAVLRGEPQHYEARLRTIDGRTLRAAISAVPAPYGAFFIVHDVGRERETAKRLRERESELTLAKQRAEVAMRSLRELYGIAVSADYGDARMPAMLELGCTTFDAEAGAVVDCTGDPFVQALYERPNCRVIPGALLLDIAQVAMDDAGGAVARHPNGWGIKVVVNGEPFGAIVFASTHAANDVAGDHASDLMGLMSTLMGNSIERRRVRAHLRQIAYYDALTGLPNRAYAQERLRDAIDAASETHTRIAVLCLDLDKFREVNETLGYDRGDALLRAVAARLERELGARGTVARLGGDTFLLVIPNCRSVEHARDLAERMTAAVGEPFSIDEHEHDLSTSIGVAIFPDDGRDDQALIKNADIAMYRAKDRGRGTYFFYNAALEAPIRLRISQERLLRQALERREFEVYYQPQLDLRTGTVACVEALVRWNHPDSGLVEPAHFIPSAEMSGLIVPLGDWVLETAARQVAQWQTTLGPLRLAVNLSGRQFHQRDLVRRIFSSLNGVRLDPRLLEVEITESIAMSDAEGTAALLAELKRDGVRTALDDFGTGYSSLGYLRRFEFDVLKIDRTFTSGIGVQRSDETIVRTVIAMAHSLGLEVVAEGVENAAQLAFLQEQGCEIIQGHVIAPAMPAPALERLLRFDETRSR